MLIERQPIIIENKESTLQDLRNIFFSINPCQEFLLQSSDIWNRNRYKYVALFAKNNGEILLCPPNTKVLDDDAPDPDDAELLAIQMSAKHIILVPFHWRYLITGNLEVECLGIHDYITYFLP
jgi:hypothetical protein